MPVITAQGLRRSYGAHAVLEGVDLTVDAGERVGVVGANGSGKSSLSRILAGLEHPDAGAVALRRGVRIGYLSQAPELAAERTALQEVLSGLSDWCAAMERYEAASAALEQAPTGVEALLAEQQRAADALELAGGWDVRHRAETIMGHLRTPPADARVATMSGGEQRRVALAKVLVASPELAILDEPTNHLDVDTIEWLEGYLIRDFPGALLLVTHDRYLLDRVATRTVELDGGVLHSFAGGYAAYLEAKALRQEQAEREEANRQNFLRRELEWLRRSPKARTTKQKARVDRAQQALAVAAPVRQRQAELKAAASRTGKSILELRDLRVELGGRVLVDGLDLFVTKGQRIGILGPNGVGKTTLLRVINGELAPTSGRVAVGKTTQIAYLSQTRAGLDPERSVYDNFDDGPTHFDLGGERIELRAYLRRFLFDYERQRQPVGSLSGGERTRVALAKLLRTESNLLMLDEPTNDLDVVSLSALEQMLLDYGGTVLVVTHDRWFLDRLATATLTPEGDGRWTLHHGGYSAHVERQRARAVDQPAARSVPSKAPAPKPRARQGLTYAERIELGETETRIAELERDVTDAEARLSDPALYERAPAEAATVARQLEDTQRALQVAMARWEELSLKQDA